MRRFVWTLQWLSFVSALLLTRQGSSAECECGKLEATSTPNKTFSGPPYGENAPIFGGIWPLPQKLVYDTTNRTLKYKGISIKFALNGDAECDILQFARETYCKFKYIIEWGQGYIQFKNTVASVTHTSYW